MLGPGSVLVSRERRESLREEECKIWPFKFNIMWWHLQQHQNCFLIQTSQWQAKGAIHHEKCSQGAHLPSLGHGPMGRQINHKSRQCMSIIMLLLFLLCINKKFWPWYIIFFIIDRSYLQLSPHILIQMRLYNYNTRGKNNLYVDSCNTTIGQKSVRHKGPKLWNELPTSLKLCTSTKKFNRQLKTYLRSITG